MRWLFSSPAKIDHARILEALQAVEKRTSAEVRIFVARHKAANPVAAARRHFDRLGMQKTRHRNSVLIFVAPRSHTFAVIGDQGVHDKCGDAFWRELALAMGAEFKRGNFTAGLLHGVEKAGALLAEHFPANQDREKRPG